MLSLMKNLTLMRRISMLLQNHLSSCCAACDSNNSGSAAVPTLTLSESFETLLVEESLDDDEDGSFKLDSGSELGEDSSEISDLELIPNDKVQIQLFCYNIEGLPNIVAA